MRSGGGNWRSCAKRAGSRASSSRGSWSSTGESSGTRLGPLLQALAHPGHQPTHLDQLVHERRKGVAAIFVALREVADDAFVEVDLQLVTLLDRLGGLRGLQDREAEVDRVAEEDARERVGHHHAHARAADRHRRDLARRAASEIGAGHQDVAGADLLGPAILVAGHAFHRVLAQLPLVQRVDRVLGRDDPVGVDVVAEGPGAAADHGAHAYTSSLPTTSLGCTSPPSTAEAAATTGLDRET